MKTIVVLAALAAVALAAPAKPDRSYEKFRQLQNKYLSTIRREKKSSQSHGEDAKVSLDIIPELSVQSELDSAPAPSSRTFKKPIIIKKKHGYHLYRDSEEERAQADPEEKCTQELKFKVCNPELVAKSSDSDNLKSTTVEEAHELLSDSEIESSIHMAKEAVENLQKMSQWKNAGPDAEIHEDIEVVRMALEHIQKNLGSLESMSLRATTLSDTETDADEKMTKTEEERMTQWKDAMENIQKNVEVARNIENSFKSQVEETDPVLDESSKNETSNRFSEEKAIEHESVSGKNAITKPIEQKDEMTASASEPKESEIEIHQAKSNLEHTLNVPNKAVLLNEGKRSENFPENDKLMSAKAESKHEKTVDTVMKMKSAEHELPSQESLHKQSFDSSVHTDHGNAHLEKSIKSAESAAFTNEFDLNTNQDNMMLMKSADQLTHQAHNVPSHMDHSNIVPLQHEHILTMKAAEHTNMHQLHEPSHHLKTPMKAAEQIDGEFQPQVPLENFELSRHSLAEPLQHHHMPPAMHADHFGHMNHGHQHQHQQHHHHQHYPMSQGHMMHHGKEADMDSTMETTMQINMKDATGKSAMEYNDMSQWKHDQSARGAYGAGYGAGAGAGGYGAGALNLGAGGVGGAGGAGQGAVGVFPHAHVGNCGIPLLLSCSPSVTSGSLAKPHSYGPASPAYRAGDDVNSHSKRDTKKTNEIPATKVKRNPRKSTKKIPTYALDKKV